MAEVTSPFPPLHDEDAGSRWIDRPTVPLIHLMNRSHKIFVGGLAWTTTESAIPCDHLPLLIFNFFPAFHRDPSTEKTDTLTDYFTKLGYAPTSVVIMRQKLTGKSRGFGFVEFSDPSLVVRVCASEHIVDGKKIEAKNAMTKEAISSATRKLFVGGTKSPRMCFLLIFFRHSLNFR